MRTTVELATRAAQPQRLTFGLERVRLALSPILRFRQRVGRVRQERMWTIKLSMEPQDLREERVEVAQEESFQDQGGVEEVQQEPVSAVEVEVVVC